MTKSNPIMSPNFARDVVALGRKYSKTGFPNPNREGCPNQSKLRAIANRDKRMTLADLPASHIVSCSPCFREYKRLRRAALLFRGVRIAVVSLAALALVLVATRFVRNHAGQKIDQSITRTLPSKGQPSRVDPVPVKVDLAAFTQTRGDADVGSNKKIHLPQKLLRVEFLLPVGLEPGKYEIRVQDSTGAILIGKSAVGRMKDGTTSVELDIDLTSAARGSFTLMIRPPALDWRRYPGEVD